MLNKVPGASDYLTVAGTAGSETYEAPNDADYIAADSDKIWFKVDDSSQRTVTTAELIGYDFSRTLVYYEDTSPNSIKAILILKSGATLSSAKDQKARIDLHLSVWWDGTLSSYGNLKDNRGVGKSTWIEGEVVTYLNGISTALSDTQILNLNTVVKDLKIGLGISLLSDFFDTIWIIGGETKETSYKNLVKDAHHITVTAEPTWTTLEGSKGNGSSQFLNTNYKPSSQGVNYKQNDAAYGIYIRDDVSESKTDLGVISDLGSSTYSAIRLISRHSGDLFYGRVNMKSSDNRHFSNADSRGMYIATRNGSAITDVTIYKNKTSPTLTSNGATASYAPPDLNVYICAVNELNTAKEFSTKQISIVFFSKSITSTQRDIIVDAFEKYMDANGKGIIS